MKDEYVVRFAPPVGPGGTAAGTLAGEVKSDVE